ncbi:hypothetical protein H0I23_14145 [Cellulophaga sp. HaHaR_3_176]|uniref:hypothetical protein n=1 Tax=Cellulophaga sp. HaHaR_3_176 TaxID=1942464 RepID=UPI001C1FE769|nr:hypothetical protein [Cellulophaga sp. HaHaR_3_176]QWX83581.1 hypothetical protein H0I23_14145 [Cellulophaga sp. HaHaR_3_176]
MSKRTYEFAHFLSNEQSKLDRYMNDRVFATEETVIFFLTKSIFIYGILLGISYGKHEPFYILLYSSLYTLIAYGCIKLLQVKYDYLKIRSSNFLGSKLRSFNNKKMNFEVLGMHEKDSNNFKNLIKGYEISEKINFIAPNKSKKGANNSVLFTIINHVAYSGITKMDREELYNKLDNHFLMANENMKKGSFKTLYSIWINEKDEKKLEERRQLIKKIFSTH